jgi:predicted negative regulator of RcsB-dependent stress response
MTSLAMRHRFRLPVLLLIAIGIVCLLGLGWLHWQRPADPPARTPTRGAPLGYDQALARLDRRIPGDRQLATTYTGEWLRWERLAYSELARARLTGSFDDYAGAQDALDRAFAAAGPGDGPHLTQAVVDFSLHRLGAAETMLDRIDHYAVPVEADQRDEVAAMRGDIAFYRGDYARALAAYQHAGGREGGDGYRLAVYRSKTGDPDAALAAIDAIEAEMRLPTAQTLANLALLRGTIELQRGDWPAAGADFDAADRVFPGHWLIEAHRAQMAALAGDRAGAIRRFTALAKRTDAPEVLDMLAALYRFDGDARRSASWAGQATAAWDRRLAQFPEAAYGHAVEHQLSFGDPRRALDLAKRDYAGRPHGATAVALAWAWLANGKPAEALRLLRAVSASPWVSAEQHVAAAQAHELLGDGDAAAAEQKLATAINPHALDREAALIWFGH